MTHAARTHTSYLPRTGPAPGTPLWGEAPRRQPVAPLIAMAMVLLLVAAPSALGSGGGSANPLTLMKGIAQSTYELTGLMAQSNESLQKIDTNTSSLVQLQQDMGGIATATKGMDAKTAKLNATLGEVGASVTASKGRLQSVDGKLGATAKGMGGIRTNVAGSLAATRGIVGEFTKIDGAITKMDASLKLAIGEMAKSGPLTKAFAQNETRLAIAGGSSEKYGVPNLAPRNRVMAIVLPLIDTMQKGGALPARKDSHQASNPIVGTALKLQVPDGANVVAIVRPFDGTHGLPGQAWFVQNQVHGF